MTVATVRTAIVQLLTAIPDIGVVHTYERYAKNLAALKALYFSAPHNDLRGWYVTRRVTSETGQIRDRSVEVIRWQIFGAMAFNDAEASELAFDNLIEAIRNAVRADETLGDVVDQCSIPESGGGTGEAGAQLDDAGPAMFCGVLCHVARIGLNTVRYLEPYP